MQPLKMQPLSMQQAKKNLLPVLRGSWFRNQALSFTSLSLRRLVIDLTEDVNAQPYLPFEISNHDHFTQSS